MRATSFLAALGAAWPAGALAAGCHLAFAAALPLLGPPALIFPIVQVRANGKTLTLLADTGAAAVVLKREAARRVGNAVHLGSLIPGDPDDIADAVTVGQGYSRGVGGAERVSSLPIDDFAIGSQHGAIRAAVVDSDFGMTNLTALLAANGLSLDGLLGMQVLGNYDIDLDFPGRQLRLYRTTGTCAQPAVALGGNLYSMPMLPLTVHRWEIQVPITIDGSHMQALVDSGAFATTVFAAAASKAGLAPAAGRPITAHGIGGTDTETAMRAASMEVGPITLRNAPIVTSANAIGEADALLGEPFLHRVHVWISNSSHTLVLQYPPEPSPPLP